MSQRITIQIYKKIATCLTELPIVCGNSDYEVEFLFDEEWDNHNIKTAVFVVNGKSAQRVFDGNVCNIPVVQEALTLWVGVFAGTIDDGTLSTTTPALVRCKPCVTDGDNIPAPPPDDVYNQIAERYESAVETSNEALEIANGVRKDADEGKFNGYTPQREVDYWTENDKQDIKDYCDELAPLKGVDYWTEEDQQDIKDYCDEIQPDVKSGEAEHSVIANDIENNIARSPHSTAVGVNTQAGAKGYKISRLLSYQLADGTSLFMVRLYNKYEEGHSDAANRIAAALNDATSKGKDMMCSIICKSHHDLCAKVVNLGVHPSSGQIQLTVSNLPTNIYGEFVPLCDETDPAWTPTNSINTIRFPDYPELGDIDIGEGSFAEGLGTQAIAEYCHAEGYGSKAVGRASHAEGRGTLAVWGSHSEGQYTQALNLSTHAEGQHSKALGESSHAEGITTKAIGAGSHSEGNHTEARGGGSHAGGNYTVADEDYQYAIGEYNRPESTAGFIVGNGKVENGVTIRSNAFAAGTKDGVAYVSVGDAELNINADACADLDVWECVGDKSNREYYKRSTIGGIMTVSIARHISTFSNADVSQVDGATIRANSTVWSGWTLMTGGVGEAVLIMEEIDDNGKFTGRTTTVRCPVTEKDSGVPTNSGVLKKYPDSVKCGEDRAYCRYSFSISDFTKMPVDSDTSQTYNFSGKDVRMHIGVIPRADANAPMIKLWTRRVKIA